MAPETFLSADARVMRSSLIRRLTGLVNRPDVISFAAGSPSAATYPHEQLGEIFTDLREKLGGRLFQYSVTRGDPELIEAVRERVGRVRGVSAAADETILVSGSQQGLDFIGRVLLDPGDAVFVEAPNFIGATAAFENFRARVAGIRPDEEGIGLAGLERAVREARVAGSRPKLVYVIPNFQNPSGRTWSLRRRRELLELAEREDLLIVEDDAYGELYFEGVDPADLAPIKSLPGAERVIYLATFSKILAAGLRVAWMMGPAEIVRRVELAKETGDLCTSTLSQKLILEYLRRGWMEPQVARARAFYDAKARRLLAALEARFGGLATWNRPRGGLFLWVELERDLDTAPLLEKSVAEDRVAYIPGSPFFVDGSGANTLRLSFSNVSDENISIGIEKLSRRFGAA